MLRGVCIWAALLGFTGPTTKVTNRLSCPVFNSQLAQAPLRRLKSPPMSFLWHSGYPLQPFLCCSMHLGSGSSKAALWPSLQTKSTHLWSPPVSMTPSTRSNWLTVCAGTHAHLHLLQTSQTWLLPSNPPTSTCAPSLPAVSSLWVLSFLTSGIQSIIYLYCRIPDSYLLPPWLWGCAAIISSRTTISQGYKLSMFSGLHSHPPEPNLILTLHKIHPGLLHTPAAIQSRGQFLRVLPADVGPSQPLSLSPV